MLLLSFFFGLMMAFQFFIDGFAKLVVSFTTCSFKHFILHVFWTRLLLFVLFVYTLNLIYIFISLNYFIYLSNLFFNYKLCFLLVVVSAVTPIIAHHCVCRSTSEGGRSSCQHPESQGAHPAGLGRKVHTSYSQA